MTKTIAIDNNSDNKDEDSNNNTVHKYMTAKAAIAASQQNKRGEKTQ